MNLRKHNLRVALKGADIDMFDDRVQVLVEYSSGVAMVTARAERKGKKLNLLPTEGSMQ